MLTYMGQTPTMSHMEGYTLMSHTGPNPDVTCMSFPIMSHTWATPNDIILSQEARLTMYLNHYINPG